MTRAPAQIATHKTLMHKAGYFARDKYTNNGMRKSRKGKRALTFPLFLGMADNRYLWKENSR